MARIIDLGNECGMLVEYKSDYANLHFKLTPRVVRRLFLLGYLNGDELVYWLTYLGYSPEQVEFFYHLDTALRG